MQCDGLLRGACHRARIRATRWLAMTRKAHRQFPSSFSSAKQQVPVFARRTNFFIIFVDGIFTTFIAGLFTNTSDAIRENHVASCV
jgi:hypothetical protein